MKNIISKEKREKMREYQKIIERKEDLIEIFNYQNHYQIDYQIHYKAHHHHLRKSFLSHH